MKWSGGPSHQWTKRRGVYPGVCKGSPPFQIFGKSGCVGIYPNRLGVGGNQVSSMNHYIHYKYLRPNSKRCWSIWRQSFKRRVCSTICQNIWAAKMARWNWGQSLTNWTGKDWTILFVALISMLPELFFTQVSTKAIHFVLRWKTTIMYQSCSELTCWEITSGFWHKVYSNHRKVKKWCPLLHTFNPLNTPSLGRGASLIT